MPWINQWKGEYEMTLDKVSWADLGIVKRGRGGGSKKSLKEFKGQTVTFANFRSKQTESGKTAYDADVYVGESNLGSYRVPQKFGAEVLRAIVKLPAAKRAEVAIDVAVTSTEKGALKLEEPISSS